MQATTSNTSGESDSNSARLQTILIAVAYLAAILFAWLWIRERAAKSPETLRAAAKPATSAQTTPLESIRQPSREVVREVQVTRVVPMEVLKEVTVTNGILGPLTEEQEAAVEFAEDFQAAPVLTDYNDALYKLDSISVHVMLNEVVKRLVTEGRVKSRFELVLGRHNIRADDKAPVWLVINYEGVWNENGNENTAENTSENENIKETTLSYVAVMSVQQEVTIERKSDWRRTAAIVWQKLACGYSDRSIAEDVLMRDVEAMAESFASNYLTVQEKIK